MSLPSRHGRTIATIRGLGQVEVRAAKSVRQKRLAKRILASVGLQRGLVLGGPLDNSAFRTVAAILKNKELRPYYEYIEAKRISSTWRERGDLRMIAGLITSESVMTHSEITRALEIIRTCTENGSRSFSSAKAILTVLKAKIRAAEIDAPCRSILNNKYLNLVRLVDRKLASGTRH